MRVGKQAILEFILRHKTRFNLTQKQVVDKMMESDWDDITKTIDFILRKQNKQIAHALK